MRNTARLFTLRPGYLVLVEYSSVGATLRLPNGDKEVDHPELASDAKAVVNAAYHATAVHSVHTPWGYLVDDELLAEVEASLKPIREAAKLFRDMAVAARSNREVIVRYFPVALSGVDQEFADRIRELIVERFAAVRTSAREVVLRDYEFSMDRARHFERVVEGSNVDLVTEAYAEAKTLRKGLLKASKGGAKTAVVTPKIDLLIRSLGNP